MDAPNQNSTQPTTPQPMSNLDPMSTNSMPQDPATMPVTPVQPADPMQNMSTPPQQASVNPVPVGGLSDNQKKFVQDFLGETDTAGTMAGDPTQMNQSQPQAQPVSQMQDMSMPTQMPNSPLGDMTTNQQPTPVQPSAPMPSQMPNVPSPMASNDLPVTPQMQMNANDVNTGMNTTPQTNDMNSVPSVNTNMSDPLGLSDPGLPPLDLDAKPTADQTGSAVAEQPMAAPVPSPEPVAAVPSTTPTPTPAPAAPVDNNPQFGEQQLTVDSDYSEGFGNFYKKQPEPFTPYLRPVFANDIQVNDDFAEDTASLASSNLQGDDNQTIGLLPDFDENEEPNTDIALLDDFDEENSASLAGQSDVDYHGMRVDLVEPGDPMELADDDDTDELDKFDVVDTDFSESVQTNSPIQQQTNVGVLEPEINNAQANLQNLAQPQADFQVDNSMQTANTDNASANNNLGYNDQFSVEPAPVNTVADQNNFSEKFDTLDNINNWDKQTFENNSLTGVENNVEPMEKASQLVEPVSNDIIVKDLSQDDTPQSALPVLEKADSVNQSSASKLDDILEQADASEAGNKVVLQKQETIAGQIPTQMASPVEQASVSSELESEVIPQAQPANYVVTRRNSSRYFLLLSLVILISVIGFILVLVGLNFLSA